MPHLFKELPDNYSLAAGAGFEPANAGLVTGVGFRLARRLDSHCGRRQNPIKLKWVRRLKLLKYL